MDNNYQILRPQNQGSFANRLDNLYEQLTQICALPENHTIEYAKVFLSDAQNQYNELINSKLYSEALAQTAHTVVEQTPLDGCKVALLIKTARTPSQNSIFQPLRLTEEEASGTNSYQQTYRLFERYLESIERQGLDMATNLVRTWIYITDIDVNYDGVVRARNDIFAKHGLTVDSHFIASTGIGGATQVRNAKVAIDFLTYPDIKESDKHYLTALEYLNPTHEYGVAFERGTRVTADGRQAFFISGTASIDKYGNVLYLGDVNGQTNRLIDNIEALLQDGGANLSNMDYFIIYLRDISDYNTVNSYISTRFPKTPYIIVSAKVCRPEWLIEVEGIASKAV